MSKIADTVFATSYKGLVKAIQSVAEKDVPEGTYYLKISAQLFLNLLTKKIPNHKVSIYNIDIYKE